MKPSACTSASHRALRQVYDIRNLLFLGRVASGDGGQIIIDKAEEVLRTEFPQLKIQLRVPDEKTKRHGQAVAAASLPAIS